MNKKILSFGFATLMAGALIVSCVKKEANSISIKTQDKSTSTASATTSGATTASTTSASTSPPIVIPCKTLPKDSVVNDPSGTGSNATFTTLSITDVGYNFVNGQFSLNASDNNSNQVNVIWPLNRVPKHDSIYNASGLSDVTQLDTTAKPPQLGVNINIGGQTLVMQTPDASQSTNNGKVFVHVASDGTRHIYICQGKFTGTYNGVSNAVVFVTIELDETK